MFTYRLLPISLTSLGLIFPLTVQSEVTTNTSSDMIVTATRQPQALNETLGDVTVIKRQDIERVGAISLVELLQEQAGLEIIQNGGPQTVSNVFIRGANSEHTLVLLDGQRINSATGGTANWANLPLQQIERIEIIRGPSSSLYGTGAIGGVIQIFTRQGQFNSAPQWRLGLGGGNQQHYLTDFSFSAGKEAWSYQISGQYERSTGFDSTLPSNAFNNRDKDGFRKHAISSQLQWQANAQTLIKFNYSNFYLNGQHDVSKNFDDKGRQRIENVNIMANYRPSETVSSTLQLGQTKDQFFDFSAYGNTEFTNTQTQLTWQNQFDFSKHQSLNLGLDYLQEKVHHSSFNPGTPTTRNTYSIFGLYKYTQQHHHWQATIRVDNSSQYHEQFSGNLAYAYDINSIWKIGGSLGSAFRAPSFNDLYFPDYGQTSIQPERSYNAELNLQLKRKYYNSTLSLYHSRVDNLINYQFPCSNPEFVWGCANNINQAILEGLSWSNTYRYKHWRLQAKLDWQNPHDKETNNLLARRAKRYATISANYEWQRWQYQATWRVSGQRYEDSANTTLLGGYGILDLSAQYNQNANLRWLLKLNNLTDKQYELAKNYAVQGRNAFLYLNLTY